MTVFLAGAGCGAGSQTAELQSVMKRAAVVAGPERLLATIQETVSKDGCPKRICAVYPEEILDAVKEAEKAGGDACVLLSGDSGFYSGTRRLLPLLKDYDVRVLPGISSLQLLAARLKRPWQEWRLCSAHGVDCDAVYEVSQGRPVFFLTGGKLGPAELCVQLSEAGLAELPVYVAEDLGTESERIHGGTAGAFAEGAFAKLSVMLAEAAPERPRRNPGFPDDLFLRADAVPMTKQVVRAAVLSLLAPGQEEVCWDIGAGTGSVSIELAMQAKRVFGIEQNEEALVLAEKNRRALGAWNLQLCAGKAPAAFSDLPAPDAVFVGGSSGNMREILEGIHKKNAAARICVSAIVLENAVQAAALLGELGYETEILQIGVSRSRPAGGKHMMLAQNPVLLVSAKKIVEEES